VPTAHVTGSPAQPLPTVDVAYDPRRARTVRRWRRLFLVALCAVLLAGLLNLLGVRSERVERTEGGTTVTVTYPRVARPGLAVVFEIEVHRDGGFSQPIQVGVDRRYLATFDENGLNPDPAEATTAGALVVWEFSPPIGDTLIVSFDARIEPDMRWRRSGQVAIFEEDEPLVTVPFTTFLLL
jgi:hypothetical protein